MYRLLIVDDEPFITDGLGCFFESLEQRFEVYKEYSANDALNLLSRIRMDIVISDIRMIGMNGLQLIEQIKDKWPICRVIILSGYNDFNYLHRAMAIGADAYVLKSEGDEALLAAVEKSIEALEQEAAAAKWRQNADEAIKIARPILQQEFLLDLLHGDPDCLKNRAARLTDLGIALAPDQDLLFVGARLDNISPLSQDLSLSSQKIATLDSIFSEYTHIKANSIYISWNRRYMMWFIQPLPGKLLSPGELSIFIEGMLEKIQKHCIDELGVSVSFVLETSNVSWANAHTAFLKMRHLLIYQLDNKDEMVISNTDYFQTVRDADLADREKWLSDQIANMRIAIEYSQKHLFMNALQPVLQEMTASNNESLPLIIYHQLCTLYLSYLIESDRIKDFFTEFSDLNLFSNSFNKKDETLINGFVRITDWIFSGTDDRQENRFNTLIYRLHQYISSHLADDLSLAALASVVYLNPVYLSRIYKQITGNKLSEYVLDCRIEKAKTLLAKPEMKINEISYAVGFESPAHFSRVFKKVTGKSPQDFRTSPNED